jgi:TRAP-type C4-dicarboxylate transport system permease large subunit
MTIPHVRVARLLCLVLALLIYAVLTQEWIGKLFVAAVIPGLIATLGYMFVIRLFVTINPASGPAVPRVNRPGRMTSVVEVLPVVGVFLVVYLLLGCVMDSLAMTLFTIPIFHPVAMGLDFYGMTQVDMSIWSGILALMVVEIGPVHPPLGMNLFIIQALAKDTPYIETAKGGDALPGVRLGAYRAVVAGARHLALAGAPQRLRARLENAR